MSPTTNTTTTPSSSSASVTAGSLLSDRLVGVGGLSNNARNRKSCQQKENKDLIIKDGKILLNEAILEEDINEMKDALILLSKSNLTTTAATSLRADDEEDVHEDENGSNNNNNNNAVIYYTEQRDFTINLSPVLYATTTLSDCIGRNEIHTDMVRLLLLPFKVEFEIADDSTISSSSTTTTSSRLLKISTNIRSIININVGYCNYKGIQLLPPLIRACHYQNYNLVRLLLDCGANVNVCGNSADGLTPLIRMAKIGDIKMIHMLLEKNSSSSRSEVNIHKYDQQSMNALIHACTENHIDIVRYLLDYSKIKNNNNNNNNNSTIDKSSDSDYVNEYKVDPPIWYACAHGNSDIVQLLIDDYGAKVAYRKDPNIYSSTPLSEACEWGHLSVVKILLERDNNGTSLSSSSLSSSSSSVPDEDEARVRSLLKARELARSAGYNNVVELIDLWSLRIQNIENTFINNNNNIIIEDVNKNDDGNDNDNDSDGNNNKDDNDDDDDNGSDNEDENNNNTKKKKQKQKKIDLIPPLLPIVLSMTARRYDLTYRIISRHKDIICQSCQQREASSSM